MKRVRRVNASEEWRGRRMDLENLNGDGDTFEIVESSQHFLITLWETENHHNFIKKQKEKQEKEGDEKDVA